MNVDISDIVRSAQKSFWFAAISLVIAALSAVVAWLNFEGVNKLTQERNCMITAVNVARLEGQAAVPVDKILICAQSKKK